MDRGGSRVSKVILDLIGLGSLSGWLNCGVGVGRRVRDGTV